jgi:hypothetical protein
MKSNKLQPSRRLGAIIVLAGGFAGMSYLTTDTSLARVNQLDAPATVQALGDFLERGVHVAQQEIDSPIDSPITPQTFPPPPPPPPPPGVFPPPTFFLLADVEVPG